PKGEVFSPMSRHIFRKSAPILLVGAGEISLHTVTKAFHLSKMIVAVDGGLTKLRETGLQADVVIGDFDSVDDTGDVPRLHRPDQNATDFQKALAAVDAPVIIGAGFLGGRLDHQFAAMTALMGDPRPIILLNDTDLCFLVPRHFQCPVPDGSPVAFYPLRPCRVQTSGVKYPVTDAAMAPDGLISTSNTMVGYILEIYTMGRGLLAILPLACLPAVISALQTKPTGPTK
ncbi:MAG: thiamine diphosphokinase, partial [Pseudomonadota bacterium]